MSQKRVVMTALLNSCSFWMRFGSGVRVDFRFSVWCRWSSTGLACCTLKTHRFIPASNVPFREPECQTANDDSSALGEMCAPGLRCEHRSFLPLRCGKIHENLWKSEHVLDFFKCSFPFSLLIFRTANNLLQIVGKW